MKTKSARSVTTASHVAAAHRCARHARPRPAGSQRPLDPARERWAQEVHLTPEQRYRLGSGDSGGRHWFLQGFSCRAARRGRTTSGTAPAFSRGTAPGRHEQAWARSAVKKHGFPGQPKRPGIERWKTEKTNLSVFSNSEWHHTPLRAITWEAGNPSNHGFQLDSAFHVPMAN